LIEYIVDTCWSRREWTSSTSSYTWRCYFTGKFF